MVWESLLSFWKNEATSVPLGTCSFYNFTSVMTEPTVITFEMHLLVTIVTSYSCLNCKRQTRQDDNKKKTDERGLVA